MTRPTSTKHQLRREAKTPFSDSLGKTLRRRRLEMNISLDEVATETKIRKGYIKAIETANYADLPHTVQSLGFVKRYAKLLGLDGATAGNKYMLERGAFAQPQSRPKKQKVHSPIIGTRLAAGLVLGGALLTVGLYLAWQLLTLTSPPRLELDAPVENATIASSRVEVRGKTTPGVEIKINGQVVFVSDEGDFTASLGLKQGLNIIKIDAISRRGETTSLERSVLYAPER